MNLDLQRAKRMIRPYLQQIPDEALWRLYARAKDGEVTYIQPCKCIRGIIGGETTNGYRAECSKAAELAEGGLYMLGHYTIPPEPLAVGRDRDHYRNLRLLPMCRWEIRRRDRLRAAAVQATLEAAIHE